MISLSRKRAIKRLFILAYFFCPLKMEIYVYDNCIILNDTSAAENPVGLPEKKKMDKLSSLPIKNRENNGFNKPPGRLVFCIFDKYMIIRTNYMSSNNFSVM